MWRICTRALLAAAQPDNLFSICFRVTHCHKVTHFSTDLLQLSTYVIYYLIKVLRCEGSIVRSVNFLLTHTVHSNNLLNSLTLNEDTYEKAFEKTGVTENESYGCNSHVTHIFLLMLIDKCLPHALVFLNTEYHM